MRYRIQRQHQHASNSPRRWVGVEVFEDDDVRNAVHYFIGAVFTLQRNTSGAMRLLSEDEHCLAVLSLPGNKSASV